MLLSSTPRHAGAHWQNGIGVWSAKCESNVRKQATPSVPSPFSLSAKMKNQFIRGINNEAEMKA